MLWNINFEILSLVLKTLKNQDLVNYHKHVSTACNFALKDTSTQLFTCECCED